MQLLRGSGLNIGFSIGIGGIDPVGKLTVKEVGKVEIEVEEV
jgi:hypothetical protein